jgi:isocitrate dehydrogenase
MTTLTGAILNHGAVLVDGTLRNILGGVIFREPISSPLVDF